MRDRDAQRARHRGGRPEGRQDVVDGAARHVGGFERRDPVRRRATLETLREERPKLIAVLDAVAVRGESRIRGELAKPEGVTEPRPLPLAPDGDRNLAIRGGQGLVRHDVRVGVATPFWAWLTSRASVEASSETSTRWPPERPRSSSAASTPMAPNSPLAMSLIATPSFVGDPPVSSGNPVIDINPPTACITES